MKYIRTKDGIIYRMVQIGYGQYRAIDKNGNLLFGIEGKQANTIEELCDEFVIEFKHSEEQPLLHRTFGTLKEVYDFKNEHCKRCIIVSIKGAIWTDKGLIYVAKMNEKGELKLL